jgi:hypothetical protein
VPNTATESYSKHGLQSFLDLNTTYGITGTSVTQSSTQNYTKHRKSGYYSSILKKEFDTLCIQMHTMINILQNFSGHEKTKYKPLNILPPPKKKLSP